MPALSFFHPTTAPLPHLDAAGHGLDMSFLQDVHPEVTDALLGFVYDPLDPAVNAGLDDFLNPLPDAGEDDDDGASVVQPCAKRPRAGCGGVGDDAAWLHFTAPVVGAQTWNNGGGQTQVPELLSEFALAPLPLPLPVPMQQPPPPPAFVRGADAKKATVAGNGCGQSVQSAAARERRKRISEKTAELSRLIPGGHKLNTAEMLQEAGRHVKLLQAQIGMLALMHTIQNDEAPSSMAKPQEAMHALLVCGGVQERLSGEGKCLVPRQLVDAIAGDSAVKSNPMVNRDLKRFMESLEQ